MENISKADEIKLIRDINALLGEPPAVTDESMHKSISEIWSAYFNTDYCWDTIQEFIDDLTCVNRGYSLIADAYKKSGNKEKEDEYRRLAFSACDPKSGLALACRNILAAANGDDEEIREKTVKYLVDTVMLIEHYKEYYINHGTYYKQYSSDELEKMLGEACYLLGGIFVDFQDKEALSNIEALYWYQKSVDNGYDLAKNMVKSLNSK